MISLSTRNLLLFIMIFFAVFVLMNSILTTVAGDDEIKPTEKPIINDVPVQKNQKDGCLVDEAAIEDVKKAREENESKQKELAVKEAELKAREQALSEEFKQLEEARATISKIQEAKKIENEEKVSKLMETFVTMSPKAAAKVLSDLDDGLAVAVLSQMETERLAKILNVMDSARSSKLSELMAGVVRARNISRHSGIRSVSHDTAATTALSTKGGDKYDGRNEQIRDGGGQQPNR